MHWNEEDQIIEYIHTVNERVTAAAKLAANVYRVRFVVAIAKRGRVLMCLLMEAN